jgi:hypothetical protein
VSGRPIPRNEKESALSEYAQLARAMVEEGRRAFGPALAAAVLEFAAKALEQRARMDGAWKPEDATEYRAACQDALDELDARWKARKAAGEKL